MSANPRQSVGKNRSVGWIVIALVLGIATVANSALADDGVVTARFHIDSAFFRGAMSAQTIAETEAAVARALAETAEQHFRYLDWQAANDIAEGPQLILRMIDKSGGACDPPPTIKLVWSAIVAGTERPLDRVAQRDLYQTCDPDMPTQEPDRLQADIVEAVTKMLGNEAIRERINAQVLKLVPIARELINHQDAMLLLPVPADRLVADSESKLVAKFNFANLPESLLPSDIVMSPKDGFGDAVQVWILAINVPSVDASLPAQGDSWHHALSEVLARASDLRVYMVNYKPSPFAGDLVGASEVVAEL